MLAQKGLKYIILYCHSSNPSYGQTHALCTLTSVTSHRNITFVRLSHLCNTHRQGTEYILAHE